MSELDRLEEFERNFQSHVRRRADGGLRTNWDSESTIRVYVTDLPEEICSALVKSIDEALPAMIRAAYEKTLLLRRAAAREEAERTLELLRVEETKG